MKGRAMGTVRIHQSMGIRETVARGWRPEGIKVGVKEPILDVSITSMEEPTAHLLVPFLL